HNIYIGFADRVTVNASYFHHAKIGHNFKSRAKENHIENSYFMDSTDGTSSYLLDFPNGGLVYLRGNLLQKGPMADNSTSIAYNEEKGNGGVFWPVNTVTLVHNTLVTTFGSGVFVDIPSDTQSLSMTANIFAGSASLLTGGLDAWKITQLSNFS